MWTPFERSGAGCGVEIRGEDLRAVCMRIRRGQVEVLGLRTVERFRERPPAEWGAELTQLLSRCGLAHVAATVALPRQDFVLRQIQLPPLKPRERDAAVRYQLEGLHPFGEDEVLFSAAPLDGGAKSLTLVAVAERATVEAYAVLFEQAGLACAAFTVGPSAWAAALRLRTPSPPRPLLIAEAAGDELEVYGESELRPQLSAEFNLRTTPLERALELALADLRAEAGADVRLALAGDIATAEAPLDAAVVEPRELIAPPVAAPPEFDFQRDLPAYAVAIEAACPRLGRGLNLLAVERRRSDSRWRYAPTAALAAALALTAVGFLLRPLVQDRAYSAALEARLQEVERQAAEVAAAGDRAEEIRERLATLQAFEKRTEDDLRILSELSALLPDNAWLATLELTDQGAQLQGEASSAAPLLSVLNRAQTLEHAEFVTSLTRTEKGEAFHITLDRRLEGADAGEVR